MAYDLGALVPLAVDVRDDAGTLTSPSTATLTITLPDGTPVAPAVTLPPATTGKPGYDYPSTQQGRHVVRWTTTGPVTAYTAVFYVRSGSPLALVSLADVKEHLNIKAATTTHDEELRDAIECATDVVEGFVGSLARRTVTETHSGRGGPGLALRRPPVLAITSVTENGVTVAASGYSLSEGSGVLYRVSGYSDLCWQFGRNNIAVMYEAGAAGQVIPPSVLDSVKELVRINFRPQLGGNYSPFDGGGSDDFGTPAAAQMRFGFFVPNKIMQLLEHHSTAIGFA